MDFKKHTNPNIPKAEYKKNNLADFMSMAQGGIGMLPMLPKKIKIGIVVAIFFLLFGIVSFIYFMGKLASAFPIPSLIVGGIIVLILLFSMARNRINKKKNHIRISK